MKDVVEMLNRIKNLEEKVTLLEARVKKLENERDARQAAESEMPPFPESAVSRRYRSLAVYLYEHRGQRIVLTYPRVEEILGFSLPATAYNFPHSYWANTDTHSYSSAWMAVGYKAFFNPADNTVRFEPNGNSVNS